MKHFTDSRRNRRVVTAAVALVALVTMSSSLGAEASPTHRPRTPKATVVLVHGAWADSGSWDDVARKLQRDGYKVVALPDPLQGLKTDSDTVAGFLAVQPGPIILVGHSYGGAVISNAATGNPNVKALVYVDAYIPDQGETVRNLTTAGSCFAVADIHTVLDFAPFPNAPAGDYYAYVKQSKFPRCFANGLPSRKAAVLASTQRPLATGALDDHSGVPAWKTIPSWAVIGTADHIIPVDAQRSMAARAGAKVIEVHAPHLSMIAKPDVVTRVIEQADRSTATH